MRRWSTGAVIAIGLVLAGCGSSSTSGTAPSVPAASPSSSAAAPLPSNAPTASASPGSGNLPVTDQVRADLIAAGATARGLKPAEFTSLRAGLTYYAYDAATRTYWAGGELVPSTSSYNAQVSSQDDGAYTVFFKAPGATWVATDSGMAGSNSEPGASACKYSPPADVLALWGWPANSCHPNGV